MIISHTHKFIFLKPYKVAGSSTEYALSSVLKSQDVLTRLSKDEDKKRVKTFGIKEQNNKQTLTNLLNGLSKQNKKDLKKFTWPRVFHSHCSANEVKNYVGDRVWNEYKKVSIIRNPWDYLLSFYHWNPGGGDRPEFKQWIFHNRHLIGANNVHYKINDEKIIDIFLRYENLSGDIRKLPLSHKEIKKVEKILETTQLKGGFRKLNKSDELEMLNKAKFIDRVIEAFCDIELEHFGYEKPFI